MGAVSVIRYGARFFASAAGHQSRFRFFSRSRISVSSSSSFVGAGSRCGLLLAYHAVHQLHHHEDAEGQDGEINALLDEGAVVPPDRFRGFGRLHHRGAGTLGERVRHDVRGLRREVADAREVDAQVAEVGVAEQGPDGRHDDIVHERRHDLAERAADDDADGHVHYVALEGEFLELLEECHDSNVFLIASGVRLQKL